MSKKMYLAKDGNYGEAEGLLRFWPDDLPPELFEMVEEDPEGAYSEVVTWMIKEGRL